MDVIGNAANSTRDFTRNIRTVLRCIRQARSKSTIEKCHFGVTPVEFPRRTNSPERTSPKARNKQNFPDKLSFAKSKKRLQRYLGFVNCYKIFISTMVENLNPFNKLFKGEFPIKIKSEIKETLDSVNSGLKDACELALKQNIPVNQLVFMPNPSSRSTGYNLIIEDNPGKKIQSGWETYTSVAFGWKTCSPAQLQRFIN